MALFPSIGELLLPNLNVFTILGIVALLLAGLSFIPQVARVVRMLGISARQFSIISFIVGIFLIWGISIVQDFLSTTGGVLVSIGIVVTIINYVLLFGNPVRKRK